MKKLQISLWLCCLVFATGCTEKDLAIYEPATAGSSIYFADKFDGAVIGTSDVMATYKLRQISLGYVRLELQDTLIALPVRFTGNAALQDREYSVEIDPASTMQQGKHFDFVDKHPVMKAGKFTDSLRIMMHRTPDMQLDTFSLTLHLRPNDNFGTALQWKKLPSGRDSLDVIRYDLAIDDVTGIPGAWTDALVKPYAKDYFGDYSRAKFLLMVQVIGMDPDVLAVMPAATADKYKVLDKIIVWGKYMAYWLGIEKQQNRIHYDENNAEITMGTRSY
ncbi:DUF4843 domain-containing protein [Chitinophaga lutea]